MNKTLLATAVAGALLAVAGQAAAQVNISVSTTTSPTVKYAAEINKPTAAGAVASVAANSIQFNLGYNFSDGEVRYARLECSSNLQFATVGAPASSDANVTVGAVNGAGTNAIHFSITDVTNGGPNADANDNITVPASYTLLNNNAVSCTYSLYDQPSQAQAGGATGRIFTITRLFLESLPSYTFTTTPGQSIADVESANGAYFTFVSNDREFGRYTFDLALYSGASPRRLDGANITLADLFAAGTNFVIAGDFAAANTVDHCGPPTFTLNGAKTTATLVNGSTARVNVPVCYNETGSIAIPASTFNITLNPVANAGYTLSAATLPLGEIIRNGTELQAPLVQLPTGYLSRIMLTNTGSVARNYRIRVIGETGNVISTNTANMSGTIPANGSKFFETNSFITGFSAGTRATVIVTVDGPNGQIQGLYQIVNPANGSISNHVMVRPGTN